MGRSDQTASPVSEVPGTRARLDTLILVFALIGIALVRIPLVLNASQHLDSDLAVDGLALQRAMDGRWSWHYPGTPHIGSLPIVLSWLQARYWGVSAATLVSGGVVAYELIAIGTFLQTRRALGSTVARWGLVPLVFSSTGMIWLSGRITGGHLLIVFWYTVALGLLAVWLRSSRVGVGWCLGLWCGLGLAIDSMGIFILFAVVIGGLWIRAPFRPRVRSALALLVGLAMGLIPRFVGQWADPYDAYRDQFVSILRPINPKEGPISWKQAELLAVEHGRILLLDCLPRLLAGHRLPDLEADPPPELVRARAKSRPSSIGQGLAALTLLALPLFACALIFLTVSMFRAPDPVEKAYCAALVGTSASVIAAFIINRNIFNSDNYRYLVLLIIPWSVGFGLACRWLCARSRSGRMIAILCVVVSGLIMTVDAQRWYARFGWVDGLVPVRRPERDPTVDWLRDHSEWGVITGPYWEVYRLAFLAGRPLRAIPMAGEPDRFPEWSQSDEPRILIVPRSRTGLELLEEAYRQGAIELHRSRERVVLMLPEAGARRFKGTSTTRVE